MKIQKPFVLGAGTFLLSLGFSSMAFAATLSLSPSSNLMQGCPANIDIQMDSQGANLLAGDISMTYSPAEVSVNATSIGSAFPLLILNQISGGIVKMSASRFPGSGSFTGKGIFGSLSITPALTSSTLNLNFNPDISVENILADDQTNNVLTAATGQVYSVKNRYNTEVDGVGFCTPDTQGPTLQLITPIENSYNNPKNTNFILWMKDDRTGINLNSIAITVDGVPYSLSSPELTIEKDVNGDERVVINPVNDFTEGANVPFSATVCDNNTPTTNCTTKKGSFGVIYSVVKPGGVCGNGILEPLNGETCDDGNKISGDGCSSLCITEAVNPTLPSCSDGIMNQGEQGIDCGGPCVKACPTCVDGIKNQGEQGIDCGGPCPSCDQAVACVNYVTNLSTSSQTDQVITLQKSDLVAAPKVSEPPKTVSVGLPFIKTILPTEKPLPSNYAASILSVDCASKAPTRYIEITDPARAITSSDLQPVISGTVDKTATKILIWRREKDAKTGELSKIKEKLGEVTTFNDLPSVSNCDLVGGFKNFSLTQYSPFPNNKTYSIEAEAIHTETEQNLEKVSSTTEIHFDTGQFAKAPSQLYLDDKPINASQGPVSVWFQNALAQGQPQGKNAVPTSLAPLSIQNSQPIIRGNTEKGVQVFAVWKSTVIKSEMNSSAEAGQFAIQSPRALGKNQDHTVTVYAIKTDTYGNKYQSPKVIVPFIVEPNPIVIRIIIILSFILLTVLLTVRFRKKLIKTSFKKVTDLVDKK